MSAVVLFCSFPQKYYLPCIFTPEQNDTPVLPINKVSDHFKKTSRHCNIYRKKFKIFGIFRIFSRYFVTKRDIQEFLETYLGNFT